MVSWPVVGLAAALGVTMLSPGWATEVLIGKGEIAPLVDPLTNRPSEDDFTYLHPGLRLREEAIAGLGALPPGFGIYRTETGLRVAARRTSLDGPAERRLTARMLGNWIGYMVEAYPTEATISGVRHSFELLPGSVFRVEASSSVAAILTVDLCEPLWEVLPPCRGADTPAWRVRLRVPHRYVGLVDLRRIATDRSRFAAPIEPLPMDGAIGLAKACAKSPIEPVTIAASVAPSFEKALAAAGGPSEARALAATFGPTTALVASYFHRGDRRARRLVVARPCAGQALPAIWLRDVDGNEAMLDGKLAQLAHDPQSGRLIVACPGQYWLAFNVLLAQGLDELDIPFFLARTLEWRGFGSLGCPSDGI
jgi:hypothetical protein